MTREQIIEKLLKIRALAEEGHQGERGAAETLLNSLMKKYGITPEDLESDPEEYRSAFSGDGEFDFKLLCQIAKKLYPKIRVADLRKAPAKFKKQWYDAGIGPKNANVAFQCTMAQFLEIMSIFELYKRDLADHLDTFFYAYLDKNDLLLPSTGEKSSPEDVERVLAALKMEAGIEKKDIYKQIEQRRE